MIYVAFRKLELLKRHPLTISRGTSTSTQNLFVFVSDGSHTGVGELAPATGSGWTADRGIDQLAEFLGVPAGQRDPAPSELLSHGHAPHTIWRAMFDAQIDPPAAAALDVALWDLLAKQARLPLYRLLGLPKEAVPTSVTVGINPPEVVRERTTLVLSETGAKCLKVKLGSPEGIEADQASFSAALEAARPFGACLRVDANGGWSVADARHMLRWLAERGADYVEQPLAQGAEDGLHSLFNDRPLPIFIDESCRFAGDVAALADRVDGVNLKLMKCGGITEALRIVATARAHGLRTMIGCMSESSVAISAGAAMGALFDFIDLDSHLNLNPDPARGARLVDGVVIPTEDPGHGGELHHD